jgi:hypothetical protein
MLNPISEYPISGYDVSPVYINSGNFVKNLLFLASFVLLSGCADTPRNRELWQAIGSGMQSAGDAINKQNEETRRAILQQNQSPTPQVQRPTNCITRYETVFKEYVTTCN